MAFSAITARGSAVVGTGSSASLSMNPTANITVDKIAFVCVVTDNSLTTDGASTDRHAISDSQGNTWARIVEHTETDGAADDGVCVSVWWSKITTQISTTDTITLTPAVNQSDMIITCFEVTVEAGNTVAIENVGVGQGTLTTSLSSLPSREYLFIYTAGSEGEDAAKTPATNYTERFDLISSTSGALDANIAIHVATRIQTTTSTGSVASSAWTGTNFLSTIAAIYETTPLNNYTLTADVQTYAITGNVTGLTKQSLLAAVTETFSITASTTNFLRGYILAADVASFNITGFDVDLVYTPSSGATLTAETAVFTFSFSTTGLLKQSRIVADTTSFSLVSGTVNLLKNSVLNAVHYAFMITASATGLFRGALLQAQTDSFTVTDLGTTTLRAARKLVATPQSYTITTTNTRLIYSGDLGGGRKHGNLANANRIW